MTFPIAGGIAEVVTPGGREARYAAAGAEIRVDFPDNDSDPAVVPMADCAPVAVGCEGSGTLAGLAAVFDTALLEVFCCIFFFNSAMCFSSTEAALPGVKGTPSAPETETFTATFLGRCTVPTCTRNICQQYEFRTLLKISSIRLFRK